MTVHYTDATVTLHHGDCLDVLRTLPDASVDAVCTDPPYGLGFMGKDWDSIKQAESRPPSADETDERYRNVFPRTGKGPAAVRFDGLAFQRWCELWTAECLRVLKPGGHLLAFGGTRTWHRLAVAVEDAGFEVRDSIAWLYGSGFPKSLDVSKAIDKAAGAERAVVGDKMRPDGKSVLSARNGTADPASEGWDRPWRYDPERLEAQGKITAPATDDAKTWEGWGTALKPAFEPIVVARKPLTGTVAANVLAHGVGALNIDGCRIEGAFVSGWSKSGSKAGENTSMSGANYARDPKPDSSAGRWPANVILDESQAAELDEQSGELSSGANPTRRGGDGDRQAYGDFAGQAECAPARGADSGGASRFFYVAKADASERVRIAGVAHPTVKPIALMRWLVRLVTPPGGTVLEPFAGSGTTVEACLLENFRCIAIEREADYLPLIVQRIHRRRDPVEAVKGSGADGGLFDLLNEETA